MSERAADPTIKQIVNDMPEIEIHVIEILGNPGIVVIEKEKQCQKTKRK